MTKDKSQIVCLCGSSKFIDIFHEANALLTLEGKIVLSIACVTSDQVKEVDGDLKVKLDTLHFKKIDMADRVHVINKDGYVGWSTLREIRYAFKHCKIVTFMEEADPIMLEVCKDFDRRNTPNEAAAS